MSSSTFTSMATPLHFRLAATPCGFPLAPLAVRGAFCAHRDPRCVVVYLRKTTLHVREVARATTSPRCMIVQGAFDASEAGGQRQRSEVEVKILESIRGVRWQSTSGQIVSHAFTEFFFIKWVSVRSYVRFKRRDNVRETAARCKRSASRSRRKKNNRRRRNNFSRSNWRLSILFLSSTPGHLCLKFGAD